MIDPAIRIRGLSKAYRIATERHRASTLVEALGNRLRKPFQRDSFSTYWALRDIDLEIERGEVVGIIGRNGAGKSTLLKILSRITEPTTGRIELFGRVGSLLEVGTGFHPELTGRENIYLNGAILGMKRSEIRRQFDAIVDFAGVEQFLDTPVKRYSSGMYVRLAFAVAAHLSPEILIVDEVLAVGDAEFQKKCLGKIRDVAQCGRTVLFVSHNTSAILNLCNRCAWLASGKQQAVGESHEVVRRYLREGSCKNSEASFESGPLRHCKVTSDRSGFRLEAEFETPSPIDFPSLGFVVSTSKGIPIFGDNPRLSRVGRPGQLVNRGTVTATVTAPLLRDGDYYISLWFGDSSSDMVSYPDALWISIVGQDRGGTADPLRIGSAIPTTSWNFKLHSCHND